MWINGIHGKEDIELFITEKLPLQYTRTPTRLTLYLTALVSNQSQPARQAGSSQSSYQ
jgi:hypothetical protein